MTRLYRLFTILHKRLISEVIEEPTIMDNSLYEEYLEQLVVEVEAKVGFMPECLLKPLSNEPPPTPSSLNTNFLFTTTSNPVKNSPYASPRMSVVDENPDIFVAVRDAGDDDDGGGEDGRAQDKEQVEKGDQPEKDVDTSEDEAPFQSQNKDNVELMDKDHEDCNEKGLGIGSNNNIITTGSKGSTGWTQRLNDFERDLQLLKDSMVRIVQQRQF